MRANELVAKAKAYQRQDDTSPAEALVSVFIDLFTSDLIEDDELDPREVSRTWQKLTCDLTMEAWLLESKALADGVNYLAANLVDAGRADLAEELHDLHLPRFSATTRDDDHDSAPAAVVSEPTHAADRQSSVPQQAAGARLVQSFGAGTAAARNDFARSSRASGATR